MSTTEKEKRSHEDEKPEKVHNETINGAPELDSDSPASPYLEAAPNTADGSEFKWDLDVIMNLAALYVTFFSSSWHLIVPSSMIGFIVEAYPLDAGKSSWIAASVSIACCVIPSFIGSLSDSLGRKWAVTVGPALMVVGSLVAGRATSMDTVIGGQVISGAGVACGYNVIAFTVEIVPKRKRPLLQILSGAFAGIAFCVGSIIAGAFIVYNIGGTHNGWRAGFYMSAGFNLVAFLMLIFYYHPGRRPNPYNLTLWQRVMQVDWIGVFLIAAGLTIFLVGLQYGGNPDKWNSARVLANILIGAALIATFAIHQWKFKKDGLLNHQLFRHRNYGLTLCLNFVAGFMLFAGQAFIPQETIYLFTSNAIMTGVYALPFNICTVLGSFLAGWWMGVAKECRAATVTSFAFLLVGGGLMAVMQPGINFAAWFFPTLLIGLSSGMQAAVVTVISSLCTPDELIGTALTVVNSARGLGGSVGVVILSVIFQHKIKEELPNQVSRAVIAAGLPPGSLPALFQASASHGEANLTAIPGITPHIIEVMEEASAQAYADSFRFIWYTLIPFAVIAIVLSLFIQPTKAQMTNAIASEIEHHSTGKTFRKSEHERRKESVIGA